MAIVTKADEQVAEDASKLLAERASEVVVSGSQIVRWRAADLFDLPEGPRQGRGNIRRYPANAAEVAAEFALVLSENRKIDEALLTAFANGTDVAHHGLINAYEHYLEWLSKRLRRARARQRRPVRIGPPDSPGAVSSLATTAMMDLFAGNSPINPTEAEAEAVIEHMASSEGLELLKEGDGLSITPVELLSHLSLDLLRKTESAWVSRRL